jgi:hypothetical protein
MQPAGMDMMLTFVSSPVAAISSPVYLSQRRFALFFLPEEFGIHAEFWFVYIDKLHQSSLHFASLKYYFF